MTQCQQSICVGETHWLDEATETAELCVTSAQLSLSWHSTCCFENCIIHESVWHKASVQVMVAVITVLSRQYPFPFCLWRALFQRHLCSCCFTSLHLPRLWLLCTLFSTLVLSWWNLSYPQEPTEVCPHISASTHTPELVPWASMLMLIEDLFLVLSHQTAVISLCVCLSCWVWVSWEKDSALLICIVSELRKQCLPQRRCLIKCKNKQICSPN